MSNDTAGERDEPLWMKSVRKDSDEGLYTIHIPRSYGHIDLGELIKSLLREIDRVRLENNADGFKRALTIAQKEMACLVPMPSFVMESDWPCLNPADRNCLHTAWVAIVHALDFPS